MEKNLRILFVEDSEITAEMILSWLALAGYIIDCKRVETLAGMKVALFENSCDLILFDNNLPQFEAADALFCYREMNLDIPFFVLSNDLTDEGNAGY